MSINFGMKWISQETAAARPHALGFNTARTTAEDTLFELWNGATNAALKFAVDLEGALYLGGENSNANMTVGLTINQGAHDDLILCLKSSDIAHGLVSAVGPAAETDDYFNVHKSSATLGGTTLRAFAEDDALDGVFQIQSFGGTADTTKSTVGRALVEVLAFEHDGADAFADITADGNVFGIRARVGGSNLMRWLVDEDGDTWQAGGATLNGELLLSPDGAITASVTQTQGNGALTKTVNAVTTVANNNDTVTLPAAVAGKIVIVQHADVVNTTNDIQIFPASGDAINSGVDSPIFLSGVGFSAILIAADSTNWWVLNF